MKAPVHDTLPLATTSPFTPRHSHAWRGAAMWTRALATASNAVRLDCVRGMAADEVSRSVVPPQERGPVDKAVVRSHAALVAGAPQARNSASGSFAGAAGGEAAPVAPISLAGVPVASASQARRQEVAEAMPCALPARPPMARNPAEGTPAPIRVHVEMRADGIAVWLGVDRTVSLASVHALVAELRAPGAAAPIVAVTCNGAVLHSRSSTTKEMP